MNAKSSLSLQFRALLYLKVYFIVNDTINAHLLSLDHLVSEYQFAPPHPTPSNLLADLCDVITMTLCESGYFLT